ncbi:hypothetical protein A2696_03160 [Candidatus Curtissbacteria bacterium RIFCSPHIGHO2_01_FULL_41_13]|uniref:Uncharacterized protein n=1 Tax=Candidatus Curtissbacteria bacterium RIFCSPHIGHO2_01_FULL_41_13 TaxID=1797745 RepID=A0A1F5G1C8_9BACT|nr:MAG: hypothetical protein A2696_03160 [Candidatus Curtissbacteria bacterium RIFCSPHIGHO2_01_FULL_41_13]
MSRIEVEFTGEWAEQLAEVGKKPESTVRLGKTASFGFANRVLQVENNDWFSGNITLFDASRMVGDEVSTTESKVKTHIPTRVRIDGKTVAVLRKQGGSTI